MGTCSKPITVQISSGEHIPKGRKVMQGKGNAGQGKGSNNQRRQSKAKS